MSKEEFQALLAPLLQAVAEGKDIEPILAKIRAKLLQMAPGAADKIDAMLNGLVEQIQK